MSLSDTMHKLLRSTPGTMYLVYVPWYGNAKCLCNYISPCMSVRSYLLSNDCYLLNLLYTYIDIGRVYKNRNVVVTKVCCFSWTLDTKILLWVSYKCCLRWLPICIYWSLGAIQCSREYKNSGASPYISFKPLVTTTFLFLDNIKFFLRCLGMKLANFNSNLQ